ncbi:CAP Gly-rich domain [Trinorchestia longiramus]|nr:CAP Gly-rich domain [Trinorchestia longiramus]
MSVTIESAALVNVRVTSTLSDFMAEKRFDRGLTIADLKARLELITGGSCATMTLQVFDDKDQLVGSLDNDNALLGSYNVEENYRIHVTDSTKRTGEFEDLSKVEKFQLSEDSYDQRNDSVRSFLRRNKLGKYNAEEQAAADAAAEKEAQQEQEKALSITVGDRCEVRVPCEASRRGEVMFVGKTEFKEGWWVGVKYDEPLGKNDGSINGKRYFTALMKYGGFTRPANVTTGDFPPIAEEDEEM